MKEHHTLEKKLAELDKLQVEINLQKTLYKQAIRDNKEFEDVKLLYLKIKELENKADEVMRLANDQFSKQ